MTDRRVTLLVGTIAFLAYLPFCHGHFFGTDELTVFETTRALFERGDLAVPESRHVFEGRDGRRYGHFAIGQSLLALPLYGVGRSAGAILPESWLAALGGRAESGGRIDTLGGPEIFAVSLYGPLASALLVALFFTFQRRLGATLRGALAGAAVLGAGTQVAMMSVYFLQHATEALALLGGFYALVGFRQQGKLAQLAAGSLLTSSVLLVRVPAVVALPPLIAYGAFVVWQRPENRGRWQVWLAALAPGFAVLALHVALNRTLWGTWLASPMAGQVEHLYPSRIHVGLFGFLLSPGCSVFLYSPPLLLLRPLLSSFWSQQRAEAGVACASALSLLLFCSSFEAWTGLWSSPGPRYLFLVIPLLLLPLGGWLDGASAHQWRVLYGLVGVGALVQIATLAARWSEVIALMQFEAFAPELRFVFLPDFTPLEGCLRAIASGEIDAWIWGLAVGWDGRPGRLLPAALLLVGWGVLLWLAVRALRRALARHENDGGPAAQSRARGRSKRA